MSDALTPGSDAKARIQSLGQKALIAFFEEVPAAAMQQVARLLPSVPGFRKTTQAGIAKQKECLARKLTRPSAQDRDYHGLYVIWRSWIDGNLQNAQLAHELIDAVEDAADDAHSPEARRLAIEKHVDTLLEKLKDESQQNRCTREQMDRLFTYSPFPETPAARGLISAAKSSAEVDRDAALRELPKRLRQDEDEIQSIKTELKALSGRLDPVAASVEKVLKRLLTLETTAVEAQATAENARNAIQARENFARAAEIPMGGAKPEETSAATEARIQELAAQIDEVRIDLRQLSSTVSYVSELRESIQRLTAMQKDLDANRQGHDKRIQELSSAIEAIQPNVAALNEGRQFVEQLSALGERLAELEQRSNVAAPSPALPIEPKSLTSYQSGKVLDLRAGLNWESLQPADESGIVPIRSHSDIANAFVKALQPLGLRKTARQIFAEECAAAVVSRQAVFLRGAFATRVARGLARAIGGPASARLAVPIGAQDGEDLRFCVGAVLGRYIESVGALAIEGINRTALDVTKEVLADCVDPPGGAPDGRVPRAAVFATIAAGIASLPIEPSYFELGPVFDLDYLDWRTNQSSDPEPAGGSLPIEVDCSIQAQLGTADINTEEAIRLARLFLRKRNPTVERVMARAYRALHVVRSDQKAVTPLHSLAYGWLLPYWCSLNFSKDQINSELDGGKCNGTVADQRLAAMLSAEFLDDGRSDGA
jgi:hypothetical protein